MRKAIYIKDKAKSDWYNVRTLMKSLMSKGYIICSFDACYNYVTITFTERKNNGSS